MHIMDGISWKGISDGQAGRGLGCGLYLAVPGKAVEIPVCLFGIGIFVLHT